MLGTVLGYLNNARRRTGFSNAPLLTTWEEAKHEFERMSAALTHQVTHSHMFPFVTFPNKISPPMTRPLEQDDLRDIERLQQVKIF